MNADALASAISRCWRPGNFYVGNGLRCAWRYESTADFPWETFRGRLLDSTRATTKRFLAWDLLPVENGNVGTEPLISVLLDESADRQIHVTRGYLVYGQNVDDALETREVRRWTRELVGTLTLADYQRSEIEAEIRTLIRQAVVGTSRLPLTSVEAPHPAFTFGQLAYLPHEAPGDRPMRTANEMFVPDIPISEKSLEAMLRSSGDIDEICEAIRERLGPGQLGSLVRRMFNDVSLSPYTEFVDRALNLAGKMMSPAEEINLLGFLLRQLARHLTAYDLVLFHYRGANFPDALFLDALLRRLIKLGATTPELMDDPIAGRMRRRALRQGLLVRRRYEGHAVPDMPTSPGENMRVLPEPYGRLSEEQILQPGRRGRRLFEREPTTALVLDVLPSVQQAFADLGDPAERRELGMALFIDRPLGFYKLPAETDSTPLLSYVAYSETLAAARMREATRFAEEIKIVGAVSDTPGKPGAIGQPTDFSLGLDRIPGSPRPAVSLADAGKVSPDFRFLRTTRSSLAEFWRSFDTGELPIREWPLVARVISGNATNMTAFDAAGRVAFEFDIDRAVGFVSRGGVEVPRSGLIASSGRRIAVR